MNEENQVLSEEFMNEKEEVKFSQKKKRNKKIIAVVFAVTTVIIVALAIIIAVLEAGKDSFEVETWGSVSPDLLDEIKDDDFDIMKYEEYLKLNRLVMYSDGGVSVSIDDATLENYDEGLQLTYSLIKSIIAGDSIEYNLLVAKSERKQPFTQQQLYDIVITKYSMKQLENGGGMYTEYVYKVEYKIHENNGTFRNDIVPDASRPQYFVINNSSGEFLLMDVVQHGYLK